MKTILNTVSHPMDSPSVLNWIVWRWSDSNAPLVILVPEGEGEAMDNRIRVRLSNVRKSFKTSGIKNFRRFGINSRVVPWTSKQGRSFDALCLSQVIMPRHVIAGILARVDMPTDLTRKRKEAHDGH